MADISKIKLPDNTVVNIKDSRILGIDSTPTSGSTNLVTSGGVKTALGSYLPLTGGEMTGPIAWDTSVDTTDGWEIDDVHYGIRLLSHVNNVSTGSPHRYSSGLHLGSRYPAQIAWTASSGSQILYWRELISSFTDGWRIIYDSSTLTKTVITNLIGSTTYAPYVSGGYLPLSGGSLSGDLTIAAGTSGTPTLNFVRGTATDNYTDWRIQNNGGVLYFDNYTSGQWNNKLYLSGTTLTPYSNVVDGVSDLTLGTANFRWSNIYANDANISGDISVGGDATFSGDVTVSGTVSATNIPTYYTGSSAPSSSLGNDGDIYLQTS